MSDNEIELKLKLYLTNGGIECPFCGSRSIEGNAIGTDQGIAWQRISCVECGSEWMDQYVLSVVDYASISVGIDDNLYADGLWGEHPDFPSEDWRYEVNNEDTVLGYWEWCTHKEEEEGNDGHSN